MMTRMRHIDTVERRARLGVRHHLSVSNPAPDVVELAGALCGLHATDPMTVFLAARSRLTAFQPGDLERALYDDRSLVRMLGMRRTVFVVPVDMVPIVHQACAVKIALANRRRLVKLLEAHGIATDADRWLAGVEDDVIDALHELGAATARELSERVPLLRTKFESTPGKSYDTDVAVNNQVLTQLAAVGRIVRGRPEGKWTSTRYRWEPIGRWIDAPLDGISAPDAESELARRWLATFGPATESDLAWWAKWTLTQTRRALDVIGAVRVRLDDGVGHVLPDDVDPVEPPETWAALLPALDPTAMGWKERDWFLGPHRDRLFDRTGNIGPTVWVNGRIVGGWAQTACGEIATQLLEAVGSESSTAIDEEAAALQSWLGDVRFKPRFPTPLDEELRA